MLLDGKYDNFGGIIVLTSSLSPESRDHFEESLRESLIHWNAEKKRGVWVKVPLEDSVYVPILVKHGFVYHHAQKDFVMLTRWLPEGEINTLPLYAHTHVGVGGLVEDGEGRILMMREKRGHGYLGWKFPGGLSDPGEHIFETAAREVKEETGVHAVGDAVILFRQQSTSPFPGIGDIYFVVSMTLKDPEERAITACPHETEEARWFTKNDIEQLSDKEISPFVKRAVLQFQKIKGKHPMRLHTIDFAGRKQNIFMADDSAGSHL